MLLEADQEPQSSHEFSLRVGSIAGVDDDLEIGRELNALSQLEAPVGLDSKLIAQCRIRRMAPGEGGADPIIREMKDPLELVRARSIAEDYSAFFPMYSQKAPGTTTLKRAESKPPAYMASTIFAGCAHWSMVSQ